MIKKLEVRESIYCKFKSLLKNKCYVYLVTASAYRFMGGYAIGFWSETFFRTNHPKMQEVFAIANLVIIVGGGVPGSFLGGYLGDKLQPTFPLIKG